VSLLGDKRVQISKTLHSKPVKTRMSCRIARADWMVSQALTVASGNLIVARFGCRFRSRCIIHVHEQQDGWKLKIIM